MITYKFVVNNFSHRDEPIDTPNVLTIPDVSHFELVLYPNKTNLRGIDNCSMVYVRNWLLHANLTYGTSEPTFRCVISILNKNGKKCYTKEGLLVIKSRKIESDWSYSISRDYLMDPANGLLPNDTLTIFCEISVMDEPNHKPSLEIVQQKHNTILNDLQSLFDSKKGSDVVLVSGETKFPAHKVILSTRSPVFGAMFEHECEEKKQNRVVITDIEPEVLGELLRYIYTGTVSSMDKYSDDLLVAADKYQIESLKSICEQSLSRGLTIESAMKLLVLSDMHNATNLKANCLNYISTHPTEVTEEHWNAVTSARPDLCFKDSRGVTVLRMAPLHISVLILIIFEGP